MGITETGEMFSRYVEECGKVWDSLEQKEQSIQSLISCLKAKKTNNLDTLPYMEQVLELSSLLQVPYFNWFLLRPLPKITIH